MRIVEIPLMPLRLRSIATTKAGRKNVRVLPEAVGATIATCLLLNDNSCFTRGSWWLDSPRYVLAVLRTDAMIRNK